jgi:uncharacterized Zn finger protein (UPF0148 family)
MNITAKMLTDHCDECGQMKPAFGFTPNCPKNRIDFRQAAARW